MLGFPSRMVEFLPSGVPGYSLMAPNQDLIRPSGDKRIPPYRIHINSIGLRGPEVNPDRQWTILALGDSITFGTGVSFEETYAYVLKKLMNERLRGGVEIINAGNEGAGIDHELVVFERKRLGLRPDIVTVQFFPNDVTGMLNRDQFARIYQPIGFPLKRYVRQTAIYGLLLQAKLNWMRWVVQREVGDTAHLSFKTDGFYARVLPSTLQRAWEVYFEYLGKLVERTRQERTPLVILIIPDVYQVARPDLFPNPQERIRTFAQRNGVPVVDPLPTFRRLMAEGDAVYLSDDLHLTARGHAVVAELLRNTLIEHNIAYAPQK